MENTAEDNQNGMERLRTLFGMLNSSVSTQTEIDQSDNKADGTISSSNQTKRRNKESSLDSLYHTKLNKDTDKQTYQIKAETKSQPFTTGMWYYLPSEDSKQPSNMIALKEPPISLENSCSETQERLSNETSKADCTQCRIVGVSALTICTAYVLYHGPRTARQYKGHQKTLCTIAYMSLSAVTATLGICRLFDIGPFRLSNNDDYLRQKVVKVEEKIK